MNRPDKAPVATIIGITVPLLIYLMIYIFAIAAFSTVGTANIMYPTIEMAKEIQVPGEFFERFESTFFTIWTMTIFNTVAMAFSVAVIGIRSMFKKIKKQTIIFILSPIIYLLAMQPENVVIINMFSTWISYFGITFFMIPLILLWVSRIRGVSGSGGS